MGRDIHRPAVPCSLAVHGGVGIADDGRGLALLGHQPRHPEKRTADALGHLVRARRDLLERGHRALHGGAIDLDDLRRVAVGNGQADAHRSEHAVRKGVDGEKKAAGWGTAESPA
jgi:hypothetical protein